MASMKFLSLALVFISLIVGGKCQCYKENLKIEQSETGLKVENTTEWAVTVKNDCACTQFDVKLDCHGFQSLESIATPDFSYSSGTALCQLGQPIYAFKSVNFTYAWDSSFTFVPVSSQMACS